MARLQDFQTVTPTENDKLLVVQSQGQGLTTIGDFKSDKMDKANPTGTGSLSLNRKSGTTIGNQSTAEGLNCTSSGATSHAEGNTTIASNSASHAEGSTTTASGSQSHAEGYLTTASGNYGSHSEGRETTASGNYSHAEGYGTISNHRSQHVFGEFNVADTSTNVSSARGDYAEIVGKGTADNARSNARTLDWSGNEVLAGDLTINGNISLNAIVSNLASVKFKNVSVAGGATVKIVGKSGMCFASYNNNDATGSSFVFSNLANTFRFKSTVSTETRLSATRDTSTGEITITNNASAYANIIIVYWD